MAHKQRIARMPGMYQAEALASDSRAILEAVEIIRFPEGSINGFVLKWQECGNFYRYTYGECCLLYTLRTRAAVLPSRGLGSEA